MLDIKHAILSPSSVFKHPSEVFRNDRISASDKVKILKQWEYDTKELLTATEENMTGDSEDVGELLSEIRHYLQALES